MNKRELKVLGQAALLIARVNGPLNSPHLTKLEQDMVAFWQTAEELEKLMKPLPKRSRRLTQRKEQI